MRIYFGSDMAEGGLIRWPKVQQGAVIGVVALGSPLSPERFQAGKDAIEARGYSVRTPLAPSAYYGDYQHGFANGSPQERLEALQSLLCDQEVEAIITARGGYGALDILPLLDLELVRSHPKPIVGISDGTALLVQGPERFLFSTIHGPTVGDLIADSGSDAVAAESVDRLFALLRGAGSPYHANLDVLRPGSGEGPLLAGNLTMLTSLLGTPWDVSYENAILVLEDVGEAPFQVHRNLLQLALAGKLQKLQGLIFGRFSRCERAHGPSVDDVFKMAVSTFLSGTDYAIVRHLPFGHWGRNDALALGCRAKLHDADFTVLELPHR